MHESSTFQGIDATLVDKLRKQPDTVTQSGCQTVQHAKLALGQRVVYWHANGLGNFQLEDQRVE